MPATTSIMNAPSEMPMANGHTPPCSAFHLLSSPPHSRAWPFAVARATQFWRREHCRPTGIGEPPPPQDPVTRPLQRSPRRPRLSLRRCRMPSRGANRHTFPSKWTSDASNTSVSRDCCGPREPTSPKDRAKSEPKGPQQAQGVPEVARRQTIQSTVCHETS